MGTTDSAGRYRLAFTGTIPGAIVGSHHVSISKEVVDANYKLTSEERKMLREGEFDIPFVELIPSRYQGRASELTAEVAAGRNTFDFELLSE